MNQLISIKWAAREAAIRFHTVTNGIPYPLEVCIASRVEQFRDEFARKLPARRVALPDIEILSVEEAQCTIRRIVDRICWADGYWGWFLAQGWHGNPAKVR